MDDYTMFLCIYAIHTTNSSLYKHIIIRCDLNASTNMFGIFIKKPYKNRLLSHIFMTFFKSKTFFQEIFMD